MPSRLHVRRRPVRGRSARPRDDRGAVAVELALVLPILVMLLLGVTTAGMAYNDSLALNNAVRESARLGAAVDYSTSPTTATAWADSVQTRVQQAYFNGGATIATSQICVRLVNSSGNTVSDAAGNAAVPTTQGSDCGTEPTLPTGVTTGTCVVKVWVSKPRSITLGVFPALSVTLNPGSAAMYGRSAGSCATTM